ncbi:MAG TPA: hypothetical protein VF292_12185, partial [Rhodanobacteraceae bacterium]
MIALALGAVAVVPMAYAQNTGTTSASTGSGAFAPFPAASGSDSFNYSNWYIVPQIGGIVPDNKRTVKVAPIGALGIGMWLSPHFTLELDASSDNADYRDSSPRAGKQWETDAVTIQGRYYFLNPDARWRPYVMLGVGGYRLAAVSGHNSWGPGETAGVGVLFNVNQRIALRGELIARDYRSMQSAARAGLVHTGFDPRHWLDEGANVGLIVNFGHAAPPPPPAAPPPPPPPPAAPPPPPPQNVVIDLRGVNFKFDRPKKGEHNIGPTLKPPASDSLAILNQAVDTLNRYPQVKVEIDGYTDSVGTPK